MKRSAAVLVFALTLSCGGGKGSSTTSPTPPVDPTSSPLTSAPGTYALIVPAAPLVQQQNFKLEQTTGSFVIASNYTYSYTISYRITQNGAVSSTQTQGVGTWGVSNGTLVQFFDSQGFQNIAISWRLNPFTNKLTVSAQVSVACSVIGQPTNLGLACFASADFAKP